MRWIWIAAWLCLCFTLAARAERIKDLAAIAGVRNNQLIGYGLVVGLNGTGDNTTNIKFTGQSLRNMLTRLGVNLPPGINLRTKNVAAVSVHAVLPPFAKPGQTIDVTVSSLGDADSLRGGSLLMTPLKGVDGQVYAIAQGDLLVGGLSASGRDGSRITVNVPSAGRIPAGATVEQTVPTPFGDAKYLTLNLHQPDFTTAQHIAGAINRVLGPNTANPLDSASVRVSAPQDPGQKVSFLSMIENLSVEPGEASAKVIVNSRTGTVVISRHVRVQPAAVSHGNLVVTIRENPEVSQPEPFSRGGTTQVVPRSDVQIEEEGKHMFVFDPGVSLNELVRAVNQVGAAPSDLVAILEALKSAGALQAEMIVI
ncbi:flagellar basal body P-ring protein FlgI [Methylohalobius crimeensis]|uniref:flagellar basal body P-ring protein FlgI n=1 Tax=Methylohalobius crimeensis TaxID=244365 RepID=UPI0003B51819|nr:flagellar basal body P-ring protein FlgI [Methylohalobius crimeensis]